MKKLLFLLLLIPFLGTSQGTFTAPVGYNTGAPTAAPSGVGTRWRFDLLTGKKYTWNPDAVAWDEDPRGIDQISGCSAPLYTPGYNQSIFAVNGCTSGQGGPKLYLYNGSTWDCLNCASGPTYTAGTGIAISGGNVISNTGDLSATNELQTLSISGQDLTLSNGGGTVTIPAGADGNGIYSGSGTVPDGTVTTIEGEFAFNGPVTFDGGDGSDAKHVLFNSTDAFGGVVELYGNDEGAVALEYNNSGSGVTTGVKFSASDVVYSATDGSHLTYLSITPLATTFTDGAITKYGFQYAAEYPDILTNDRSIPDVGLTKTLIASEGWSWPLLAPDGDASAPSYSFENAPRSGLYKASKGIALFAGSGNSITIATQNETADPSQGITITTGSSEDGETGSFLIFAGESINATGGGFSLQSGSGALQGGGFTLSAGNSSAGAGGEFSMASGSSAVGNGGRFLMTAGNSGDSAGGDIVMTPGSGITGNGKFVISQGDGIVFPILSSSQISAIASPTAGQTVYCSDCTATDSSTGVQQVYNGSTWKNAW